MSANNKPVIYTDVRPPVNESNRDIVHYIMANSGKRGLNEQNNKPDNPLRKLILTGDDFNMIDSAGLLFSSFITLYGERLIQNIKDITENLGSNIDIKITHLGHGAYGSVFRLEFTNHNKSYIIKFMNDSEAVLKRQNRREIKILFHLKNELGDNSWCIVNLHAAAFFMNTCFLLYEYIAGRDLYRFIDIYPEKTINNTSLTNGKRKITYIQPGTLEYNQIANFAYILIIGLACIHLRGVIHNDIKPENIMIPVNPDKLPFFIDFGFSTFRTEEYMYQHGTPAYLHKDQKSELINGFYVHRSTTEKDLHAIEKTFLTIGIREFEQYRVIYEHIMKHPDTTSYYVDEIRKRLKKIYAEMSLRQIHNPVMHNSEYAKQFQNVGASGKAGGRRKTPKRQRKTRKRTSH